MNNQSVKRIARFHELKKHPWYSRLYKKLSAFDKAFIENFTSINQNSDKNEFCHNANRLFLGHTRKPVNESIIVEILNVIS